jgi:hypothetical protein
MPDPDVEPPTESDYCVACDDYHDPDDGPCAVIVMGDDSD